jgi:hypothetical protein
MEFTKGEGKGKREGESFVEQLQVQETGEAWTTWW